ncbi:MAG: hypothetical protein Q8N53_21500 [Longimicrobiales bacterium]|nr:hypothetical protein [Longimicrobiales bacterium]
MEAYADRLDVDKIRESYEDSASIISGLIHDTDNARAGHRGGGASSATTW